MSNGIPCLLFMTSLLYAFVVEHNWCIYITVYNNNYVEKLQIPDVYAHV